MYKPFTLLLALLSIAFSDLQSQDYIASPALRWGKTALPWLAVKTNLLYNVTTTLNIGGEIKLSDYLTLDLSVSYNPFEFGDNKKFKHLSINPELRYWIYEPFNGHFLGPHLLYTNFNAGNIHLPMGIFPELKDSRYRGNGYGIGLSYGYQWIMSPRWNLEAGFGFGYIYLDYSRFECKTCGKRLEDSHKNYFGPTKAAISLIYVIKQ